MGITDDYGPLYVCKNSLFDNLEAAQQYAKGANIRTFQCMSEIHHIYENNLIEKFTEGMQHVDNKGTVYEAYTAGAIYNSGQKDSIACCASFFGKHNPFNGLRALSGENLTKGKAELEGIYISTLRLRKMKGKKKKQRFTVYTDSDYALYCIYEGYMEWEQNGWRDKKGNVIEDKEEIQKVLKVFRKCPNIQLKKVDNESMGHSWATAMAEYALEQKKSGAV